MRTTFIYYSNDKGLKTSLERLVEYRVVFKQ